MQEPQERMLKYFEEETLRHSSYLRERYAKLAHEICDCIEPGPERTVALRKLLESMDCIARA